MTKLDFMSTVGYSGDTAVVNKGLRSRLARLSNTKMIEEGYLRASLCEALWDAESNPGVLDIWLTNFCQLTGHRVNLEGAKRMLGVYKTPDSRVRILKL